MSEKQLLYVNLGLLSVAILFIFLSFFTVQSESAQGTMILISEIVGGLTVISAGVSIYYIKSDQKYMPVAILSFFVPWILYVIGHHSSIGAETDMNWLWFVSLYILIIVGLVFIRISYNKIEGAFALVPVFLLFINAMFFVYLVILQVWWNVPSLFS
ncbi:hypothetical protein LCM20_03885 [Halobacillus litoralis]|uniref:hypothetical protein n=1 Tax=Halobacillus litoralis TaxID=45668 RepID=UPI001CD7F6AE|nr:hypothetical protein [Halobacillus litoralis]MCA0969734.1 hypothetical protein [Halobacillus litoralis]